MRDDLFEELVQSLREGRAILRGQKAPSRTFEVKAPDVKKIRSNYGISQKAARAATKVRSNMGRPASRSMAGNRVATHRVNEFLSKKGSNTR